MGFVPKRKTYRLVFEGTEYDGLEVRMRTITTGDYLTVVRVREADEETPELVDDMLRLLAGSLVSWNLEGEDGTPVPATLDGVMAQEFSLVMAILNAWERAVGGVPAPLDSASPSGGPSLEASIPMDTLSESPESYAVPA